MRNDRHAESLQHLERARQVEERLGPRRNGDHRMSRERGKIGAHIAVQLRTAMHTANATGGEHRDSGERGECQRCRHRCGTDGPPFGDCDRKITLGHLARWPEDALVLGVVEPDSSDSVDHGSHRRNGTMRAHRSNATI